MLIVCLEQSMKGTLLGLALAEYQVQSPVVVTTYLAPHSIQ